jgi:uncharacterized OB-fold protein
VSEEQGPVKSIITPVRLEYNYTPGVASSRFLKAIAEKRLVGQRCPETGRVYIPPRGSSPTHGVPTVEEVEVADKGTVVSYCIVRVPSANIEVELPYVAANVLLDGADIAFQALLRDVDLDTMRMGLRVQAVWVEDAELSTTFENIKWFVPIDEPDTPFDDFKEHL